MKFFKIHNEIFKTERDLLEEFPDEYENIERIIINENKSEKSNMV